MEDYELYGCPLTVKPDENGKGEGRCENSLSFRHQQDGRGDEYRQRNSETSFNERSEHEKVFMENKKNAQSNTTLFEREHHYYVATCFNSY